MTADTKLRYWVKVSLLTVFLALLIRAFLFESYFVPSSSMAPTLKVGDHIFVNRALFGIRLPWGTSRVFPFRGPQVGDVVVFHNPHADSGDVWPQEQYFVKRIVAVPGDEVALDNGLPVVNGKVLTQDETLLEPSERALMTRIIPKRVRTVIPKGRFYVVGDNLQNSVDSRHFGAISEENITGKVLFVYWSWSRAQETLSVRWSRIGTIVGREKAFN